MARIGTLALQRKVRRDHEYAAPSPDVLHAVMNQGLPETVDDLRAWFSDRLDTLQAEIRGSNTDMWVVYWTDDGQPRRENCCRDRLIDHLRGSLDKALRLEPEAAMPRRGRADIAVIRNRSKLPVEIKCQWHRDLWTAASEQLDARYTQDWQAEGRGAYIVLWFGNVPERRIRRHPERLDPPQAPDTLRRMLVDRLPEDRRPLIDVYVMDVSPPASDA